MIQDLYRYSSVLTLWSILQFFDTPHSASLLSVLQKLLVIDRDSPKTEAVFSSLDKFLDSAIAMSDPNQVGRVTQVSQETVYAAYNVMH